MAFHEVQFPSNISRGSAGGPERRTQIVTLASGFEERNSTWAHSRRKYDASLGLRSINDLHDVIAFWEARLGRLHAFRWKDWTDFKSCPPRNQTSHNDQTLGTGNGTVTQFQLTKRYTSGSITYTRNIVKPVAGTVKIGLNGVNQVSGWTVDTTTGVVTFTVAPGAGVTVSAGYEFDVPVRFGTDSISVSYEAFEAGAMQSIEIVEVRV